MSYPSSSLSVVTYCISEFAWRLSEERNLGQLTSGWGIKLRACRLRSSSIIALPTHPWESAGKALDALVSQATEKDFRELNERGSIKGTSRFTHRNFRKVVQRDGFFPHVQNAQVLCPSQRDRVVWVELLQYAQQLIKETWNACNFVTN
jgi:hypothetical protein